MYQPYSELAAINLYKKESNSVPHKVIRAACPAQSSRVLGGVRRQLRRGLMRDSVNIAFAISKVCYAISEVLVVS